MICDPQCVTNLHQSCFVFDVKFSIDANVFKDGPKSLKVFKVDQKLSGIRKIFTLDQYEVFQCHFLCAQFCYAGQKQTQNRKKTVFNVRRKNLQPKFSISDIKCSHLLATLQ